MFGGTGSFPESGRTIFQNGLAAGTVPYVFVDQPNVLLLAATVTAPTAQRFRAESRSTPIASSGDRASSSWMVSGRS